jgi:hypothetical protein
MISIHVYRLDAKNSLAWKNLRLDSYLFCIEHLPPKISVLRHRLREI